MTKRFLLLSLLAAATLLVGCIETDLKDQNLNSELECEGTHCVLEDNEPQYEGPPIVIKLEWNADHGDLDLTAARYRNGGTYYISQPGRTPGYERDDLRLCEVDRDCESNEYCVFSYALSWNGGTFCYDHSQREVDDSILIYHNRTFWGRLDMDAVNGMATETIVIDEPQQTMRVVVQNYWRTDYPVAATVTISVMGQECSPIAIALPNVRSLIKVADINWDTATCDDIQKLNLAPEITDSFVHDPFDDENPRSIWCDDPDSGQDPNCR
ncbi:hypothetical protein HN958_02495 [Candidatus Falkowbacteria bacterium]|jgi:hypothetical protein|nr:hypothetical protein [Candidatus Falkowbacteria bacterium]